ncbi:MAG: FAD-dependent oxidoreductase [Planctomycetota bacterium]|jgi:phytoene dehydrogenase-like protein|nr:FAD-dependent oxidoreductase [Planctomycetota bacterium]
MRFDSVVVGAGPSGLAAAARMSHFGAKVSLIEAHTRPGGLNSWHYAGGREISTGLHALTNYRQGDRNGPLGKLFRQLRIKLSFLSLRPQIRSRIRFPSAELFFDNNPEFFRSQVAERFPNEIDGFDRLRRLIAGTDEGDFAVRQTSARTIVANHIHDPLFLEMLFCPTMFYANPGGVGDGLDAARSEPDMDWTLFCIAWKCIFESGFAYPAAGVRPLWEELIRRVCEAGGEVRLGDRVTKIVSQNGLVTAVRLASGREVEAKVFFSSAGAVETAALLGERRDRPIGSISVAEGLARLSVPAREIGFPDTALFYSLSDRFEYRRPDGLTGKGNGVLCATGNYAWLPGDLDAEDHGCLKITQLASYPAWKSLDADAYAEAKRQTAREMVAALAGLGVRLPFSGGTEKRRFPPLDDLFTPLTLERYASHAEGALYGSPIKTRRGQVFRDNLFLIGTDQGFQGVVGAMLSGIAMANIHFFGKAR